MARASATSDPRFLDNPITEEELNELDIEISVLSPLQKTDNPLSLRLGIDGIYIKRDYASGCFLPQVATETGWNKEEFLSYCCAHKAGLPADAWKDPQTEVYLFTAEVFGAEFTSIQHGETQRR
jgi:AmmeMemoRadiSam system protein A